MSAERPTASSPEPPGDVLVVDARDLRCPLPVIRLARAARDAPAGRLIEVWSTDPAARADVPAWCRMRHQVLVEVREDAADGAPFTAHRVRTT